MKKISTIPFYHIRPGQIGTTLFFIQISVKFFTKAFCSIFSSNSPLNLQPTHVTLKSVNHNLFYQRLLHALNIAAYPIQLVKHFFKFKSNNAFKSAICAA